jgi:hypothetical protein
MAALYQMSYSPGNNEFTKITKCALFLSRR